MKRFILRSPAELNLSDLDLVLGPLLENPAGIELDLQDTHTLDLAALQLLLVAAREGRLTTTPTPLLEQVCTAAGIDVANFQSGDLHD